MPVNQKCASAFQLAHSPLRPTSTPGDLIDWAAILSQVGRSLGRFYNLVEAE